VHARPDHLAFDFCDNDQPHVNVEAATVLEGDALTALDKVDDASCSLLVTSPPYNIGKEYERDKRRTLPEYLEWIDPIMENAVAKVSDGGHVCWQTGNFVEDGEVFPLDFFFYERLFKLGLKLRNRIIWHFNFGLHAQRRFSGRYETLLWFTKGDDYYFNLDPVRVPQKYPGKRHSSTKGERAGLPSGNPKGKNPSDFWTFDPKSGFDRDPVWEFPNVKANHPEKTFHPCQFPTELVERCVLALTRPGETVLDPFIGSGTTGIAALKHGRKVVGIDRDPRYVALARTRFALLAQNQLVTRPMGKPIYKPSTTELVAQLPEEWVRKGEAEKHGTDACSEGEAQTKRANS